MQVVIRFDNNISRHKGLIDILMSEMKKLKSGITIIGPMNGFCVSPVSWNNGLTLAARLAVLIRDHGTDAINDIELRVEKEVGESDTSTLFNEWRGH